MNWQLHSTGSLERTLALNQEIAIAPPQPLFLAISALRDTRYDLVLLGPRGRVAK